MVVHCIMLQVRFPSVVSALKHVPVDYTVIFLCYVLLARLLLLYIAWDFFA